MRLRLLTLDATVVVVPAEVTEQSSAPFDVQGRATARPVRSARALPPGRSQPSGRRGLAEAARTIEEGAAILAAVRRDGVSRRNGDARR